jgi:hypothetical protein
LIASQIYIVYVYSVFSPFDEVPRHMSAPLYCYTAEAWLVFATVTVLATAKATAMGMRIGIAMATAMLTVMATAIATATAMVTAMAMAMATSTATEMATAEAMVIEWQQLAMVMVQVIMLTA